MARYGSAKRWSAAILSRWPPICSPRPKTIKIGLCVANVWKREAATTINAARTLASLFENRFVLGVGVSHQKFVDRYGMHYEKPYQFMREYVARMKAAPFLGPKPKQEPP